MDKLRLRQRRQKLGSNAITFIDTEVPPVVPLALLSGHEPVISVIGGGDPAVGATVSLAGATSATDYNKTPDSITAEVFMSADAVQGSDTLQVGATWPHTLVVGDVTKWPIAKVTATFAGDPDVVTWSNLIGPVTAAPAFSQDPRPEEDDWTVAQEEIDATTFGFKVTLDLAAEAVQWTNTAEGNPSYENTGADDDGGWEGAINDLVDNMDGTWSSPVGVTRDKTGGIYAQIGIRYKADVNNPQWSLASPNRIALQWTEQEPTKYYNIATRTAEEFSQYGLGPPVQEGLQWFRSFDQVGDQVYIAHDVGGVWESSNDALLIRPVRGEGIFASGAQSICMDPSNTDCFWHVGLDGENAATTAIYFSDDKGATADIVYSIPAAWHANGRNTGLFWKNFNLAVDPTTLAGATSQRRVYAVIQKMALSGNPEKYFAAGAQVLTREPGAATWTLRMALTQATHGNIYGIFPHPSKAGTAYKCTSTGLWKTTSFGTAWNKLSGTKGIPAGPVRQIWIDPDSPSSGNADVIIFGVHGVGVYKTTNSFATNVTTLKAEPSVNSVVVSTANPDYIFIITNDNNNPWYTHNGGTSWFRSNCIGRPGSPSQARIGGSSAGYANMSFISPHPTDPEKAWAHGGNILFRTINGGVTWTCWAHGFTGVKIGGGKNPIGFDIATPTRFICAAADFSCLTTENMNSFKHENVPGTGFTNQATQSALCGAMEPIAGSDKIIITLGRTQPGTTGAIARSTDLGVEWTNVDSGNTGKKWTIFWDTADVDFVYCGDRRSINNGASFSGAGHAVAGLTANGLVVWGIELGTNTTSIYKATNGHNATLTWSLINTFNFRMYGSVTGAPAVMGLQFFPPFECHPTNANRYYTINSGGELVRVDSGVVTTPAQGPLALAGGRNPVPGLGLDNGVANICVDKQHPEVVYAFLKCTGIPWCFMSQDDGTTWEDITENIPLYGAGGSGGQQLHPLTGELFTGYYLGSRVRRPPLELVYSHLPVSVTKQLQILH